MNKVCKIILNEGKEYKDTEINIFDNTEIRIIGYHLETEEGISDEVVYKGTIEDLLYHLWINKV